MPNQSRIVILMIVTVLLAGCFDHRLCNCKPVNELGAIPDENGLASNQWLCRQTENAQHYKSTIFLADWEGITDRLSPFGKKQLGNWSRLSGVQPILHVESSGDSFLDSRRQNAISGYLAQSGSTIQLEQIQIVNADDGLEGEEVPAIADRFLGERTNSGASDFGISGGGIQASQPGGIF